MTNTEYQAWKLVQAIKADAYLSDKHHLVAQHRADRYDLVHRPSDNCFELVGFVPDPRWETVVVKRWIALTVLSKGEVYVK